MTFLERVNTITNGELLKLTREWVRRTHDIETMDQTAYNTTQWLLEECPEANAIAWICPLLPDDLGKGPQKTAHLVAMIIDYNAGDMLDEWSTNIKGLVFFVKESNVLNLACTTITEELNKRTTLPKSDGRYWVGEHEADGTLGILYTRKVK